MNKVLSYRHGNPGLDRIDYLISPFGVVSGVRKFTTPRGLGRVDFFGSFVGSGYPGRGPAEVRPLGAGNAFDDPELARRIAIVEGAERYSAAHLPDEVVWATADQLIGSVIEAERIPRCSDREYEHPGCPLEPFDPREVIRWTRARELTTGEHIWIPAIMASYALGDVRDSERFWYRLSTGCAAHTDPAEAVVRGILEVIERDAIAMLWLQRLGPPRISTAAKISEAVDYLVEWSSRHFIETFLFDATTDLDVPTVYCLQISAYDPIARQVVGCSSARSLSEAAEKAIKETISSRGLISSSENRPITSYADFKNIEDGARYMGVRERGHAFDFLIKQEAARIGNWDDRTQLPKSSDDALDWLVARLAKKRIRVFVVDQTPRELGDVGLTAVRVVIPDLLPMTLHPLAQYRGHKRLYEAPLLMGQISHDEENLNPWPQPFA
jgi:ribosomal protein S12 methylthiotransferase accessory factor